MAELAHSLLRTVARAFYSTDHILVIDALINHYALQDTDLAIVMGMHNNTKALRKLCGRLREDGLVSVQARAERRTDGSNGYVGNNPQPGKERFNHRDWYYLNFHKAIDSIKYRMYKLNKHVEGQAIPTAEKKDYLCPQCKSQYTVMEVMNNIDFATGSYLCHRCGHALDDVSKEEGASENEGMKRLNIQFDKIMKLLQEIDGTNVPENDFAAALSQKKEVTRTDANPAAKVEFVDHLSNRNLQSTKGLEIKPEKIDVQLQDDEDVKRANAAAEVAARKEREARQNALPEWISKSTVSGDITAVGAKEERQRREREAHAGGFVEESNEDGKPNAAEEDVMANYWAELARDREQKAAKEREEEEEDDDDDDDDDEFEDVDVSGGAGTPATTNGALNNGTAATSTGVNTPNVDSSNATDDERDAKRVRLDPQASTGSASAARANSATEAASDEDEDDFQFEDV